MKGRVFLKIIEDLLQKCCGPEKTRRVLHPAFCPNRISVSNLSPTIHIFEVEILNLQIINLNSIIKLLLKLHFNPFKKKDHLLCFYIISQAQKGSFAFRRSENEFEVGVCKELCLCSVFSECFCVFQFMIAAI